MHATALLVLFISALHVSMVKGCGFSTHINIGREASTFFVAPSDNNIDYAAIIRRNQDAFISGK